MEFKSLVGDTRRRFAVNYLRDRRNTLSEIAFLLGYSEASAFSRAFKRWTGVTPLAYRRQAARETTPGLAEDPEQMNRADRDVERRNSGTQKQKTSCLHAALNRKPD